MSSAKTMLSDLNSRDQAGFVAVCGPLFEHSPWIAERTWKSRPFPSLDALHQALVGTMLAAGGAEQVALVGMHPDLVGHLARERQLTAESHKEQTAAGLGELSAAEGALFERYNAAYRARFGFPFVICARENRKEAILAAFPVRLAQTRDEEIATALREIAKIARLRLVDAISEK